MSPFVAGDWGTSHLRLSLIDDAGRVLETKRGPGVATLARTPADIFADLASGWDTRFGALPAVLCGMAGSTLGWREVPYLSCPIHPRRIADGVLRFEAQGRRVAIAPGLSCRNRLLGPDVMRGEETQILGALLSDPALAHGRHILCMPGTHTKWVLLHDGVIEHFLTGVSGELFEVLSGHSVLVGAQNRSEAIAEKPFALALEQTRLHPDAELIHLLFATRSRQLAGEIKPRDAQSYLSGLIIGQDVAGALRLYRDELERVERITVIGAMELAALYVMALDTRGRTTKSLDGATASLAGLKALHEALSGTGLAHAS
jgi:2-dehydro-3-deoxygalactonokinase